jgi:predicted aconitase with swiveling domain
MTAGATIRAVPLVPGEGEGPVLVLDEPLSFWGGLDSTSGRVIDHWHPQRDRSVTGAVLVMPAGRGSSSGSSVLAEAIRLGTGPAAILLLTRDAIVTVGAMVAAELYGSACPVALIDPADLAAIRAAGRVRVRATASDAEIR